MPPKSRADGSTDDKDAHGGVSLESAGDCLSGKTGGGTDERGGGQENIDSAIRKFKPSLRCVQCQEMGTLAKNGTTRFNGKILKCGKCNK